MPQPLCSQKPRTGGQVQCAAGWSECFLPKCLLTPGSTLCTCALVSPCTNLAIYCLPHLLRRGNTCLSDLLGRIKVASHVMHLTQGLTCFMRLLSACSPGSEALSKSTAPRYPSNRSNAGHHSNIGLTWVCMSVMESPGPLSPQSSPRDSCPRGAHCSRD